MSPDDEDTAAEVSEHSTGQPAGPETSDAGASQEFSDVDVEGFTDSMEEAMGLYGASAIGKGMSQAQFNAATGRTNYNPHPNSFFSQLFGRENVDYTAQYGGPQGVAAINAIALDVYNNPIDAKGNVRGAVGQDTAFGKITSVDRKQGPMEIFGRSMFGLTPLGPLTSLLGTKEKSIAPISTTTSVPTSVPGVELSLNPEIASKMGGAGTGYAFSPTTNVSDVTPTTGYNYNPTLDPNNPAYEGPQSMLGQFGKSLEQITFGGARPVTESAKGIMSLYEAQDAKRAMGGYETFDGQKM
tara:strand:+ start:63 stop:956 length:894 start_codon:yes stop_codon:yes gene_type:complete